MLKRRNKMKNTIHQIFKKLLCNDSLTENCYTVANIPPIKAHKLGIDREGRPMFFIQSTITDKVPNINLEMMSVQFNELCRLKKNNAPKNIIESYYTVITLKTDLPDYVRYFLDIVCIVLEKIGETPSQQVLLTEIQKIIDLFRRFSAPPLKTIQGLWAELFVIERANNPKYLVKSWHTSAIDTFDFNDGTDKIEVKSTSRNNRIHHLSHNQLTPNKGSNVVIASIQIVQSGMGKSIHDLRESIESKLNEPDLRFKLIDVITKTLGADFDKAHECCFDYALACDSYRLFDINDIPCIDSCSIPEEIDNIHYDCNLSSVKSVEVPSVAYPKSELFKAL